MMLTLQTFDGTIVKIVNSKKSAQMIVCCFITNTLALVEQLCSHHPRTWCRNPSFGLATKAKGIARVRAKRKPRS
jgi:hypothetical protein